MDKYRNSSLSLSSSTDRLLNSGPLYTMCGSNAQQQGPKLLMNSASVGTATQFQFVPARNSTTISGPFQFGFTPIFNSVKTFFSNLIKPNVDVNTNSTYSTIEKRKCKSAPNIYMDIMSDGKSGDSFDKNCVVDLTNLKMLAKLSSSTKSFSDYNNIKKPQHVPSKMDLNYNLEESNPKLAKESETTVPAESQPSVLVPPSQTNSFKMPNVPAKPWIQCRSRKRTKTRKSIKSDKNKKESKRHELAFNIHEDIETENESMSTDEWDEWDDSLVVITATDNTQSEPQTNNTTPVVTFSKDDFPAMPECKVLTSRRNSNEKQTGELPRPSSGCSLWNGKKQRRISDCDSEDSFIVFDKSMASSVESNQSIYDRNRNAFGTGRQRQISESSEDDFICFEIDEDAYAYDDEDIADEEEDDDSDSDQMDSDSEPVVEVIPEPLAEALPGCLAGFMPARLAEVMRRRVVVPPEANTSDEDDDEEERETTVRFNPIPVIHLMRTWKFAYEKARRGEWEQCARDRYRFRDRIRRLESTLAPILNYNHRKKIYFDRYIRQADNDTCSSAIQN